MKTKDVIDAIGSVRAIADLLGISQQAVYRWKEDVPELRMYQIMMLRPDIYPNPTDGLPVAHQEAA